MDPSYSDEKRTKKLIDKLYAMADNDEEILKGCPCGGQIVVETSEIETMGRRYFTYNVFENDDLHRRKCWVEGVEEKVSKLREVDEQQCKNRSCELLIKKMRMEQRKNAEDIAKLKDN